MSNSVPSNHTLLILPTLIFPSDDKILKMSSLQQENIFGQIGPLIRRTTSRAAFRILNLLGKMLHSC